MDNHSATDLSQDSVFLAQPEPVTSLPGNEVLSDKPKSDMPAPPAAAKQQREPVDRPVQRLADMALGAVGTDNRKVKTRSPAAQPPASSTSESTKKPSKSSRNRRKSASERTSPSTPSGRSNGREPSRSPAAPEKRSPKSVGAPKAPKVGSPPPAEKDPKPSDSLESKVKRLKSQLLREVRNSEAGVPATLQDLSRTCYPEIAFGERTFVSPGPFCIEESVMLLRFHQLLFKFFIAAEARAQAVLLISPPDGYPLSDTFDRINKLREECSWPPLDYTIGVTDSVAHSADAHYNIGPSPVSKMLQLPLTTVIFSSFSDFLLSSSTIEFFLQTYGLSSSKTLVFWHGLNFSGHAGAFSQSAWMRDLSEPDMIELRSATLVRRREVPAKFFSRADVLWDTPCGPVVSFLWTSDLGATSSIFGGANDEIRPQLALRFRPIPRAMSDRNGGMGQTWEEYLMSLTPNQAVSRAWIGVDLMQVLIHDRAFLDVVEQHRYTPVGQSSLRHAAAAIRKSVSIDRAWCRFELFFPEAASRIVSNTVSAHEYGRFTSTSRANATVINHYGAAVAHENKLLRSFGQPVMPKPSVSWLWYGLILTTPPVFLFFSPSLALLQATILLIWSCMCGGPRRASLAVYGLEAYESIAEWFWVWFNPIEWLCMSSQGLLAAAQTFDEKFFEYFHQAYDGALMKRQGYWRDLVLAEPLGWWETFTIWLGDVDALIWALLDYLRTFEAPFSLTDLHIHLFEFSTSLVRMLSEFVSPSALVTLDEADLPEYSLSLENFMMLVSSLWLVCFVTALGNLVFRPRALFSMFSGVTEEYLYLIFYLNVVGHYSRLEIATMYFLGRLVHGALEGVLGGHGMHGVVVHFWFAMVFFSEALSPDVYLRFLLVSLLHFLWNGLPFGLPPGDLFLSFYRWLIGHFRVDNLLWREFRETFYGRPWEARPPVMDYVQAMPIGAWPFDPTQPDAFVPAERSSNCGSLDALEQHPQADLIRHCLQDDSLGFNSPEIGYHWLLPTCAPGYRPARTPANYAATFVARFLVDPPAEDPEAAESWEALTSVVCRHMEEVAHNLGLSLGPFDLELCRLTYDRHMAESGTPMQKARWKQAVESAQFNHTFVDSPSVEHSSVFVKTDELLFRRNDDGTAGLKPRPIISVNPRVIERTAPEVYHASKLMANIFQIPGKMFVDGRDIYNTSQFMSLDMGLFSCYITYASGLGKNDLDDWVYEATGGAPGSIYLIVLGDDSLMIVVDLQGNVYAIENDFKMFDWSERLNALLSAYRALRTLGVSEECVSYLLSEAHATLLMMIRYVTDPLTLSRKQVPRRSTGGADTTAGNSLVSIISGVSLASEVVRIETANAEAARRGDPGQRIDSARVFEIYRHLGLHATCRVHEEVWGATFLKGWILRRNDDRDVWARLPSAILKAGKSAEDPLVLLGPAMRSRFMGFDLKHSASVLFVHSMALQLGAMPHIDPLITAFIRPILADIRTKSSNTPDLIPFLSTVTKTTRQRFYKIIDTSALEEEDIRAILDRFSSSMDPSDINFSHWCGLMCDRYGVSEADVLSCLSIVAVPGFKFMVHPLFERMAAVDYG